MSGSKDLAPAPSSSPAIAEPTPRPTAPPKKARRIPRKVIEATEVLLDGRAKNLTQAAKLVGCSREYLSRVLSQRPDCVQYMREKAARVLGVAVPVAAARMANLIHAESEHVSYRASEHVLGVAGLKPAADNVSVNIGVEIRAGYVIDLSEDGREQKIIGGQVIDAKPVE